MSHTLSAPQWELAKKESHCLREGLAREMADMSSGGVSSAVAGLLAFHGVFYAVNRDTQAARLAAGMDKEHEFSVRLNCPGGRLTRAQYLGLDELAGRYGDGSLRLTTRQALQLGGVAKAHVKPLLLGIHALGLTTFASGGDAVHSLMVSPAPASHPLQQQMEEDGERLTRACLPSSPAYSELWLDGAPLPEAYTPPPASELNPEPLYGRTYLPGGVAMGLSFAQDNAVDVLSCDIGWVALAEGEQIVGYNLVLGGGYGRLADAVAFVPRAQLLDAAQAALKLYRDHGDRTGESSPSLSALLARKGADWARHALEGYLLYPAEPPRATGHWDIVDWSGWHAQDAGHWCVGIPLPGGRIMDREPEATRSALAELVQDYGLSVRLTAGQQVLLGGIRTEDRLAVEYKLQRYGVKLREDLPPVYRHALACAALPYCPLAQAEAERVQLPLLGEVELLLEKYDVQDMPLSIRLAGCASGCARPLCGDVALVGQAGGVYALYVGGHPSGTRLGSLMFEAVPLHGVPHALEPFIRRWAQARQPQEGFSDFCARYGLERLWSEARRTLTGTVWAA
jgi:sulfite reductase (ferredoxin)